MEQDLLLYKADREVLKEFEAIGTVEEFAYAKARVHLAEMASDYMETQGKIFKDYVSIGTVSEFRELKEKATEKKVVEAYGKDVTFYLCPSCERVVANSHLKIEPRNCSCCAQKLDWSEGKE